MFVDVYIRAHAHPKHTTYKYPQRSLPCPNTCRATASINWHHARFFPRRTVNSPQFILLSVYCSSVLPEYMTGLRSSPCYTSGSDSRGAAATAFFVSLCFIVYRRVFYKIITETGFVFSLAPGVLITALLHLDETDLSVRTRTAHR